MQFCWCVSRSMNVGNADHTCINYCIDSPCLHNSRAHDLTNKKVGEGTPSLLLPPDFTCLCNATLIQALERKNIYIYTGIYITCIWLILLFLTTETSSQCSIQRNFFLQYEVKLTLYDKNLHHIYTCTSLQAKGSRST